MIIRKKSYITCKLCKQHFFNISSTHLRKVHSISLAEYKKRFPNAPLKSPVSNVSQQEKIRRRIIIKKNPLGLVSCKICGVRKGVLYHHLRKKHNLSVPKYKKLYLGAKVAIAWNKKPQKKIDYSKLVKGKDYVECRICGLKGKSLTTHLLMVHKINASKYRKHFPNAQIVSAKTLRNKISSFQKTASTEEYITKMSRASKRTQRNLKKSGRIENVKKKRLATIKKHGGLPEPWNKGLTTDDYRVKQYTEKRKKTFSNKIKGKKYEEYMGKRKAILTRKKQSKTATKLMKNPQYRLLRSKHSWMKTQVGKTVEEIWGKEKGKHMRKIKREQAVKQIFPKYDTKIEKMMGSELRKRKIFYKKQKPLYNRTRPDFVIPNLKIAIYCDGDYWHGYEHKLKDTISKDSRIRHNIKQDKQITPFLQSKGWSVLRFWEHQIKKDISKCVNRIEKKIRERKS